MNLQDQVAIANNVNNNSNEFKPLYDAIKTAAGKGEYRLTFAGEAESAQKFIDDLNSRGFIATALGGDITIEFGKLTMAVAEEVEE